MTNKTQELQPVESVTEIAPVAQSQSSSALNALVSQIESGNLQPEQLGMVLDAQERILDRQAKMDFAASLSACQGELPAVLKTKYNEQTRSKFEDLESLNKVISPVYTKHGFSVSFGTDQSPLGDDFIRVTAKLTHAAGHDRDYFYDLPYDEAGIKGNVNKTKIHASASTLSYGRRYLLKMIFNLTTTEDVDDDAQGAVVEEIEFISEEQLLNLEALISEVDANKGNFIRACRVDTLENLPVGKYNHAVSMLVAKRDQK